MKHKLYNSQEKDSWILRARLETAERLNQHNQTRSNPCCRQVANLKYAPEHNRQLNTVVLKCRLCKKLHYHLVADAPTLGVKMLG